VLREVGHQFARAPVFRARKTRRHRARVTRGELVVVDMTLVRHAIARARFNMQRDGRRDLEGLGTKRAVKVTGLVHGRRAVLRRGARTAELEANSTRRVRRT